MGTLQQNSLFAKNSRLQTLVKKMTANLQKKLKTHISASFYFVFIPHTAGETRQLFKVSKSLGEIYCISIAFSTKAS